MNVECYLNDAEVVELINAELADLQDSDLNSSAFRYASDMLNRILEGLNHVSSIVIDGNEIIL